MALMTSDKIRWGLIGCGDIARKRVAPAIRDLEQCDFLAVNRSRSERAKSFAEEFGARKWYDTWRELIADDEIDAIYIATPVDLHSKITIAAAEAGKHVLCEKPMALTVEECDDMIGAAAKHSVALGIAYYRHFYPMIARIKEIISTGEIGQAVMAQINTFEWFDSEQGEPRPWRLDRNQSGGGPMADFGCHRIEVLINIFGSIQTARGLMGQAIFKRDVEDSAVSTFKHKKGMYSVLSVTHGALEPQDTLSIFGSEGSLHVPVLNDGTLIVKTRASKRNEEHPNHPNIHQPLLEDFTNAILEKREPLITGEIGREVNRILDQLYAP
ncbi:Gfo/Idh/MocA family protein [Candidatus Neomarinimicrobiota bacterium]